MSESYPWEEAAPGAPEVSRSQPLQMELEATAAPGAGTTSPAADAGAAASDPDQEPPAIPPVVQPDGDPRRPEQAGPPADPAPQQPAEPPAERPHGDPLRPSVRERPVARKEYYSIGEVSELAGLPAHVLRYWETQFPVLNPSKNRSGNRAYQRKEIKLILLVKHLLYEEKYTVEGAKAKLDQLRRGGLLAEHTAKALDSQTLALLREDVARLRELLAGV